MVRKKHLEVVKQLLATDQAVLDYEDYLGEKPILGYTEERTTRYRTCGACNC